MNAILKPFSFRIGTHRGKNVIWIEFEYSTQNMKTLSQFCKPHYSVTAKSWYTFNTKASRDFFGLEENYMHAIQKIHPINRKAFNDYLNHLKLKAYSPKTIDNYRTEFTQFLNFIQDQPVQNFTPEQPGKGIAGLCATGI